MSNSKTPPTDQPFDDGFVGAGRPLGFFPSPVSEEDSRRLEEAWNDMAFYHAATDEGGVTAGYMPKQTVDPNWPLIPSPTELAFLPRRAQVAFAARCARRILPVIAAFVVSKHHLPAFDRAVRVAEAFGAHGADGVKPVDAIAAAGAINGAGAPFAAAAATAAGVTGGEVSGSVAYAAVATAEMLCRVVTIGTINDLTALARDFHRLSQLARHENWTDDTPVPPSVFGPMWEGPPPAWWTDDVLAGLSAEPAPAAGRHEETAPSSGAAPPL